MAWQPYTPDEPKRLARLRGHVHKARNSRHAAPAVLIVALALIVLLVAGPFRWTSGVPGSARDPIDVASPEVIDAPFAPKALRPLTPVEAEAWNRQIPQSAGVSPASSIVVTAADPRSFVRSLQCMTEAIYYEAGNEPIDGQRAVAQVILNRMRSPVYPHSVCGVVYQGSDRKTGCQFTFTCDGSLARVPTAASWARASGVAAAALSGGVYAPVGWATNYHADYVVPYWAQSLVKLTTVGRHIFYGWKGASGTGAGFTSRYAGVEPDLLGRLVPGQQPGAVISDTGSIVAVTTAERPLIHFGLPEEDGTKVTAGKAANAANPAVTREARWVIGGPGKGPETKPAASPGLSEAIKAPPALQPTSAAPEQKNSGARAAPSAP
jgi:hypothetical protein